MPSPRHQAYQKSVRQWCTTHAREPDVVPQLKRYADEALLLWHLDLEPARPGLVQCYADNPRGGDPRDPVVMLRCLLMAVIVGQPSLNAWPNDLDGSRVLRVLAGLDPNERRPGVGTLYDFLHRLHDGPIRGCCEHAERPSETERRRARTPRKLKRKPKAKDKRKAAAKRQANKRKARKAKVAASVEPSSPEVDTAGVTEKLVAELKQAEHLDNPNDLLTRLGEILIDVAVGESGRRGLLGDVQRLVLGGDGSPLRTGANRYGKRVCGHRHHERCDCAKLYSDPDAQWGWDSHRKQWFFGHHFYEISSSEGAHDLPLAIRMDPANGSDFTASLRTFEHLRKTLRRRAPDWQVSRFIADAGHDAEAIYGYFVDQDIVPVIPLKADAPATHPGRADLNLSRRGVPTCAAGCEMAHWGSAGKGRTAFICPLKANKLDRCPLAPEHQPDWHCRPDLKWGPVVTVKVADNPRLCPPLPRNASTFATLYNLRSGTERSNAVKKETYKLEAARHRRTSFWLIRLHLIAILQHARTWVAREDSSRFVRHLLGRDEEAPSVDKAA